MDEREPKGTAEMLGETCREAAVLFVVFIPLDLMLGVAEGLLSLSSSAIAVIIIGSVFGSSLLQWIGMRLEHWR